MRHGSAWILGALLLVAPLAGTTNPAAAATGAQPALAAGQANPAPGQVDKRIKRDYGFYEPEPFDFDDHTGYVQIFDGATLNNWDGDPNTWHVEDGAIVGESTQEKPLATVTSLFADSRQKTSI